MIPRIVHQTYTTWDDVPAVMREHIQMFRQSNPEWQFRFYSNEHCIEFIRDMYGEQMQTLYLRINPAYGAARADFFRYLLMYAIGGVYLDIKSTIVPPIDSILQPDDEYLLSEWSEYFPTYRLLAAAGVPGGKEFQQWHIICGPQHPFLDAVINQVAANIRRPLVGSGKLGVLYITGPIVYTFTIHPLLGNHPHRRIVANDIGIKYNALSANGESQEHISLMDNHYSKQRSSVIIP